MSPLFDLFEIGVEVCDFATATRKGLVDYGLEPGPGLVPLLVASYEIAHVVADIGESPCCRLRFHPFLHFVRKRDVHCGHRNSPLPPSLSRLAKFAMLTGRAKSPISASDLSGAHLGLTNPHRDDRRDRRDDFR